jgi:acetyltransferase-like isoleucine patch superfamily enzyme
MSRTRHGVYTVIELLLRLCVVPRLRARVLGVLGASVGRNVRVGECRFINLADGFSNLTLHDDVHVGADCLLDLAGPLTIGRGSVLSPRVTVMTHNDPGASHGSPLVERFPPQARGASVGAYCWVGTNATLLAGTEVGDGCVVGAMTLVRGRLPPGGTYVGVPARRVASQRDSQPADPTTA